MGAYVHVPFCARICPYCDFAVVEGRDELADRYARALALEIAATESDRPIDAVFVGGGTPSRFGGGRLASILSGLRDRFGLAAAAEVTLEANPEDWTPRLAETLVLAGYTRVSFGAQSLDQGVLADLGRRHGPAQVESAVSAARRAGFRSISVDLIFGTPGESVRRWQQTLDRAVKLGTDHVSCYALTVERGTPLGRRVAAGAAAPDPDLQADQWELARDVLGRAGFVRYEVSNWARPGHVCRYNLAVWGQGEYLAFGNGAHGFTGGRRHRNVRRLEAYLDRVEDGGRAVSGSDPVTGWEAELDRLFVGLRRAAGVADGPGVAAFAGSMAGRRLMAAGVVATEDGRMRILDPLLTDEVERVVLDLEQC